MKTSVFSHLCPYIDIHINGGLLEAPWQVGREGVIGKKCEQGSGTSMHSTGCSVFNIFSELCIQGNTRRMDSTSAHSTVMQRDARIRDINIGQLGLDVVIFCKIWLDFVRCGCNSFTSISARAGSSPHLLLLPVRPAQVVWGT